MIDIVEVRRRGRWTDLRRSVAIHGGRVGITPTGLISYIAAKAYLELQRKANEMKLFVFDTETGGLDPAQHSLLTLAGVVWEDGEIVDQIDLMICEPIISTTPEAMQVNKLDLATVRRDGLKLVDAVGKLEAFLKKHWGHDPVPLAGHNVAFDVGFLRRLYRENGRNNLAGQTFSEEHTYEAARSRADLIMEKAFNRRFSYRLTDTQGIAMFLNLAGITPTTNQKLGTLIDAFKVDRTHGEQHNALADATYTAKVLTRMIEAVQPARATT